MPELRDTQTGVIVSVSEDRAGRLGPRFVPVGDTSKGGVADGVETVQNRSGEPEKVLPARSRRSRRQTED